MLRAALKLVAISMGTLMLVGLAVIFVRWMGFQQVFKAPPHPWFARKEWQIWSPQPAAFCGNDSVDKVVPNEDWIVHIVVKRHQEDWFVECPSATLKLDEFLSRQKQTDWLLQVRGHETWGLDQLVDGLKKFERDHHFAIMAEAQKVSIYLRKKAPEMLFAADSAVLLRFQLFANLWIEPAMDFWPDFVVTDFGKGFRLDARGAAELQRRQKRIIWRKSADENATPPPQVNIQGIMTTQAE